MGQVYQNSLCNIAALSAVDSTEGLYLDQDRELQPPWYMSWKSKAGEERLVEISISGVIQQEFSMAALLSRAWVVQERMLAPRTLYFGRRRLFWECRGTFEVENLSSEPMQWMDTDLVVTSVKSDEAWSGTAERTSVKDAFYNQWIRTVEYYIASTLTFPSDRLIAIAGFVNCINHNLQDEYIAGLWKGKLNRQLIWCVKENAFPSCYRPGSAQAPSWSWASIEGAISYQDIDTEASESQQCITFSDVAEILIMDIENTPVLGSVSAQLSIRGWLLPLVLDPEDAGLNNSANFVSINQPSLLQGLGPRQPEFYLRWDTSDDRCLAQASAKLEFLPLNQTTSSIKSHVQRVYGIALVQEQHDEGRAGTHYRRVGRVHGSRNALDLEMRLLQLEAEGFLQKSVITLI